MMEIENIPFTELSFSNLFVDRVYEGGNLHNAGDEPIHHLLPVGILGGFRIRGSVEKPKFVVLATSGKNDDWPDHLDPLTGHFYYFGDNKTPGKELHDTNLNGNALLKKTFEVLHSKENNNLPPFLVFESGTTGHDVIFKGLAAPGGDGLTENEDLIAVWRTSSKGRYQNYKAVFTILDIPIVTREWITDLIEGNPLSENCPKAWRDWQEKKLYRPLTAEPTIEYRTKEQQIPDTSSKDMEILKTIHAYFSHDPYEFEKCAVYIWEMIEAKAGKARVTRRSKDGGRDAIGHHSVGISEDPVEFEYAIEAKCYDPENSVNVKETSRLISRLLHRQYGVIITTSFVHKQAYEEIRKDRHPVVIISGGDIVNTLKAKGKNSKKDVQEWLTTNFPITK